MFCLVAPWNGSRDFYEFFVWRLEEKENDGMVENIGTQQVCGFIYFFNFFQSATQGTFSKNVMVRLHLFQFVTEWRLFHILFLRYHDSGFCEHLALLTLLPFVWSHL